MIQQTFEVADGSFVMLWYKQKSLIPDIVADNKLNVVADKAVDVDKKWNFAADKKLNVAADKAIDANKE